MADPGSWVRIYHGSDPIGRRYHLLNRGVGLGWHTVCGRLWSDGASARQWYFLPGRGVARRCKFCIRASGGVDR